MSRQEQPWLRLYTSALDNHKVQSLRADLFRTWVNLLLLYKRHGGVMPDIAVIAFALRISQKVAAEHMHALVAAGLMDITDDVAAPHDWDDMQYSSDTSAARTRAYRKRHNGVTNGVDVTSQRSHTCVTGDALRRARFPDADAETELGGDAAASPPPLPARKTQEPKGQRLPPDWSLPDEWHQLAITAGIQPSRIGLVATTFANYWHAKAGKDAAKRDWRATWQNWCLRDAGDRPATHHNGPQHNFREL